MKKIGYRILLVFALLAYQQTVWAADLYFAATSAGSNNGTNCANAYAYTDATHGINSFQTASWVPGNTIHICGTITGASGDEAIVPQASGTAGNPITIHGEVGSLLTSPRWGAAVGGAISLNNRSFITVEDMTIQNTANGSGLAENAASHFIYETSIGNTDITLQRLALSNLCQHTDPTDLNGCGDTDASSIFVNGGVTHFKFTQSTVHDANICFRYETMNGDTDVSIDHNTLYRCNWELNFGNGTATGVLIHDNDISCVSGGLCNWDTGVANRFHHNGMMIDPQAMGSSLNGWLVYNNFLHDINPSTQYVFLDPLTPSFFVHNWVIFNNVTLTTAGQLGAQNGTLGMSGLVANNTIVEQGPIGIGAGVPSDSAKNNIVVMPTGSQQPIGNLIVYPSGPPFNGYVADYNDYYNSTGGGSTIGMCADNPANNCYASVPLWNAATGQDAHSITTNPNLTGTFTLNAGSPAIGTGVNLTSLSIAALNVGAPQTFGRGGVCGTGCVPRSAGGAWDIGAYPFSTSTPPGPPPNPILSKLFMLGDTGKVITSGARLNVRVMPNPTAQVVSTLDNGSLFTITGGPALFSSINWWQISKGWIVETVNGIAILRQ